ncbi:MAG: hypothetical protein AAFQ38_18215 [Pseudomonadota bacterium]
MNEDHHARGGAAVGVLNRMEAWEANLVLNLRLWCEGPCGQQQVWNEYRKALSGASARNECHAFESLIRTLVANAIRPMVRHDVGCSCVGADECVFLHLVRCAADGHLNDAALMAALIVGPSKAEHIAVLAGQVGTCARQIHNSPPEYLSDTAPNVVRFH